MHRMKSFILIVILFSAVNVYSQWQLMETAPIDNYRKIIFTSSTFYTISAENGVAQSVDSGFTWMQTNNGLSGEALSCFDILLSGDNIFLATVDGIYLSTDGGFLWIKKSEGMITGGGANNIYAYTVFENNNKIFAGTYLGVYISTDYGENWTITSLASNNSKVVSFKYFNGILFAGKENNTGCPAYKTTNSGTNWQEVPVCGTLPIGVFSFFSEGLNLFAATGHGVWTSTNSGLKWQMLNSGLPVDPFNSCIIKYMNSMFTAVKSNGGGVYKSSNNGISWQDMSEGLPYLFEISCLEIFNNKIYAATSGGIYVRDLEDIITGNINIGKNIPASFILHQNYPNPFNPSTKIDYDLHAAGQVTLSVYDVTGKFICNLVNENQDAGSYNIYFNAVNYSSGIYYYRLKAGDFTETKKMILVK